LGMEVIKGTLAEDGSRKRYFLRVPLRRRTPCEAVAWTYGVSDRDWLELRN